MVWNHTAGVQLREKTLLVYVDGNSWAAHFAASSEAYRQAINEELGEDLVEQVRFSVSKRAVPATRIDGREQDGEQGEPAELEESAIPLSEVELSQIKASVERIPDEDLREAVLRATVRDLERKKGRASNSGPPASPHGL
jgi:hypothetical protein